MSGSKSHIMVGQVAIAAFILIFAAVFFIFWNWDSLKKITLPISIPGIPSDFNTQLILIIIATVLMIFIYAAFALKKPTAGHSEA